ncbi:Nucleoside transporter FUN26 like protein [Verticillium longisporum]|uniref:Nucleoside transporter FUN26 like protein n=1 Tax=Verticillium longisporum TaxID=100787 RepID=A0A8I2ZCF8_VERLO|nr:Nucleoside transporter FUN26 like protein [Verticillium longisporum]
MDRIRDLFRQKDARDEYSPIIEHDNPMEGTALLEDDGQGVPFSWFEYSIFALLGMAMLWAWNMFLAAAPYFQLRFRSDVWITQNFQSAILTVSTITNLGAMLVLTNMQAAASYPFRINLALTINVVIFMLLTASTSIFLDASPALYLTFLLTMVAATALAAGLIQNGAFAFAASFSRPEYMQALMAGQGVAGVLPPLAQIMTVLAVPEDASGGMRRDGDASDPASGGASSSAFIYFLTAVIVSLVALGAFHLTVGGHPRKTVSPLTLLGKLHWLSAAVALCFAVSMFFPVFTGKILSVRPADDGATGSLFRPAAFIPLAFFVWNAGDLAGRMATALPFSLRGRPPLLLALAVARLAWLPLYLLCNLNGRGAVVASDLFYLAVVQFPFGLTNGWLGASCMMAGSEWVDEGEREVAGGFMGLCLVTGLTVGSILSFTVAGI